MKPDSPKAEDPRPPKIEDRSISSKLGSRMGRAAAEESLRVFHLPSSSAPRHPLFDGRPSRARRGTRKHQADRPTAPAPGRRTIADGPTLIQIRGAEREDERGQRPRAHPPPPEDVGDPPAAVVRPLRRGRAGERAQEAPAGRRGRRTRGRRGGRRAGRQAPLRRGDVRPGGGRPAGEGASQGEREEEEEEDYGRRDLDLTRTGRVSVHRRAKNRAKRNAARELAIKLTPPRPLGTKRQSARERIRTKQHARKRQTGRESLSFTRSLVFYGHGSVTPEHEAAARHVEEARSLRKKYHGGLGVTSRLEKWGRGNGAGGSDGGGGDGGGGDSRPGDPSAADGDKKPSAAEAAEPAAGKQDGQSTATSPAPRLEYVFGTHGIAEVYDASDFRRTANLVSVPSLPSFVSDYSRLVAVASSGAMRSFSFQRLQMLTSAYKMHVTVNGSAEDEAQSGLLGTDFYRTMKVDNHIHLAAAATARQFVDFVREKLEGEGDTVVMEDGTTLKEVFERAGLDSEHLTVDAFDVLADYSTYQRFDNFNRRRSCLAGWGARHILPVYTTLGRDVAVIKSAPRGALEPPRCALHPIRSGSPPWESNDVKSVRVPNSSAPLILPMKGGTGTRSSEWDEK
ncbi:hypothetical protein THAOC_02057 [Thalassiosira oceanica]|uniref:Uncharacterized protein n=1 Tax=Thalassiosira oceanica TaxID=159749 RepID=K0TQK3_THAOC|nr:hypothetical protein THAOC_02057 [Thalassiosira oceanica]|eukprot:EJK76197.1 hypothetical protein THAOC_02057 [Thalassiosira oceanica]